MTAGWKAQMNQLSYGGPIRIIVFCATSSHPIPRDDDHNNRTAKKDAFGWATFFLFCFYFASDRTLMSPIKTAFKAVSLTIGLIEYLYVCFEKFGTLVWWQLRIMPPQSNFIITIGHRFELATFEMWWINIDH